MVEVDDGGGEEEEEEVLAGGWVTLQVDVRKDVDTVVDVGCDTEVCQGKGDEGAAEAGMFRLT